MQTMLQNVLLAKNRKIQTDVAILAFSKVFYKVPNDRLLGKRTFLSKQDPLLVWTMDILKTRDHTVMANGIGSSPCKFYQECDKALY